MSKKKTLQHRKQLIDRAHEVVQYFIDRGVTHYGQYFKVACPGIDTTQVSQIFNLRIEPSYEPTLELLEKEIERLKAA